jgi:hypothetical protein
MITTIYLDMDDVLTDFSNTYHKVIGIDPKTITPDMWVDNWHKWVNSRHFVTQPMLPGAKRLLEFVEELGVKTEILSSTGGPDFFEEIVEQKKEWLKAHNIWYHANFVPGKKFKTEFATSHRLLIDDQGSIIDKWIGAGGLGIHHTGDMEDTIAQFQEMLLTYGYKRYEE